MASKPLAPLGIGVPVGDDGEVSARGALGHTPPNHHHNYTNESQSN
jgi:hypothetical protein